jgi:hypothetical protein
MAADQALSGVLKPIREAEGKKDVGAIVDGLGDRSLGLLLCSRR